MRFSLAGQVEYIIIITSTDCFIRVFSITFWSYIQWRILGVNLLSLDLKGRFYAKLFFMSIGKILRQTSYVKPNVCAYIFKFIAT